MAKVKFAFYNIKRCGYFPNTTSEQPSFGELPDVLSDIYSWIHNAHPTIRETQTFSPPALTEYLPSYCYNILKNTTTGDYFLTLWNETPATSGKFASINSRSPAGEASVDTIPIPEDGIPGHHTMFWFIPDHGVVVSVIFHESTLGIRNMVRYLQGYLERFSKWTVIQSEDDRLNTSVLGYRRTNQQIPSQELFPSFAVQLRKKNGDIRKIKSKRAQIKSIIKKDSYESDVRSKKTVVNNLLKYIGLIEPENPVSEEANFEYEMEYKPSRNDLDTIITNYENIDEPTKWDDIGFKIKSEGTLWLGNSIVKAERNLQIEIVDGIDIYDRQLFDILETPAIRNSLLNELNND